MSIIITVIVLETPHVIVGAAIATKVVNPALAIPLAFASHFVLEKVPHWNPHLNTELKKFGKITNKTTKIIILDSSIALISGIAIASRVLPDYTHAATILAACFIATVPDLLEGPYYFLKSKNQLIKKWVSFQKSIQEDTTFLSGITTQFATIIAALWWIQ